jgi:hypothetical protein
VQIKGLLILPRGEIVVVAFDVSRHISSSSKKIRLSKSITDIKLPLRTDPAALLIRTSHSPSTISPSYIPRGLLLGTPSPSINNITNPERALLRSGHGGVAKYHSPWQRLVGRK